MFIDRIMLNMFFVLIVVLFFVFFMLVIDILVLKFCFKDGVNLFEINMNVVSLYCMYFCNYNIILFNFIYIENILLGNLKFLN